MKAAREAAEAIHRHTAKKLEEDSRGRVELGFIRDFDPLQVEMAESADVLEGNTDVFMSQFLRWWDGQFGLAVGDTLLLASIREGIWIAFDVRSQHPVDAGLRPGAGVAGDGDIEDDALTSSESSLFTVDVPTQALTLSGSDPQGGTVTVTGNFTAEAATVTWARHIGHKLPVYDKDGNLIGWVPVFNTLP
jgi:hypothetical protein